MTAPTTEQSHVAHLASQVEVAIGRLRDDVQNSLVRLRDETDAALRHEREKRIANEAMTLSLADGLAKAGSSLGQAPADVAERLDALEKGSTKHRQQIDDRMNRMMIENGDSIRSQVDSAVRELDKSMSHRQEVIESALEGLQQRLNDFDQQAARMVEYFTEATETMGRRIESLEASAAEEVEVDLAPIHEQLDSLGTRVDQQLGASSERASSLAADLEVRVTEKFTTAMRMSEERTGQQIADMDAYLGQTGAGLDDAITMLNDRISALDERITNVANG